MFSLGSLRIMVGILRWFGHAALKTEDVCVSKSRYLAVNGCRNRSRKTWFERVEEDMRKLQLKREDAQNRAGRRSGIFGNRLTRASPEKTLKQC